jgi:16S rRNA processing protein RimM
VSLKSTDRLVEIGVVGRPHSIYGEVRIFLHNRDSSQLSRENDLLIGQPDKLERYALGGIRETTKYHIARLKSVSTREAVEKLKGAKVFVERSRLPNLESDEFYVADLIGLAAWDGDQLLGRIVSSRAAGGVEVIQIAGEQDEVEVPLVEQYVESLDLTGGRVNLTGTDVLPRFRTKGSRGA